jgi:hypothetical protein
MSDQGLGLVDYLFRTSQKHGGFRIIAKSTYILCSAVYLGPKLFSRSRFISH